MDNTDRKRFLAYLSVFNTENQITGFSEKLSRNEIEVSPRLERLVHIISYCLMNNHFHILLVQARDNGIAKFMQKLGTGYTMYFNKRYERVGSLFQGVFKAVRVDTDEYLSYLHQYIHANPLDFSEPEWRQNKIKNTAKALERVRNYPWSSFSYYAGETDNPIIDNESVIELFKNKKLISDNMREWLNDISAKNNTLNSGLILE